MALALALALVPPVLLALILAILERVSPTTADRLHRALLGALFAAILAAPLGRSPLGAFGLALAAAAGFAFARLHVRAAPLRSLTLYASAAALVVPGAFLLATPIRPLLSRAPGSAFAAAEPTRPAPVVFVVFDELPLATLLEAPGAIDGGRFPNFARLARSATWYARTVTPGSATDLAVPAMLEGKRPRAIDVPPVASAHPANLFSILPPAWPITAWENVTQLCTPSRCGGGPGARLPLMLADAGAIWLRAVVPPALASGLPSIEGRWGDYWNLHGAPSSRRFTLDAIRFPEVTFREFLDSLGPPDAPWLAFLHLNLPHMPHQFLPSGQRYASAREPLPDAWPTAAQALLAEQRHLLATGYADRLLGELLDRLEARGLADRALLVVASDHGVAFRGGRSSRAPDADTLGEIAPVPLFIRAPGQRTGSVVERDTELVDVLPLVGERLGLSLPAELDGVALPAPHRRHVLMDAQGGLHAFTGDEAAASLARAIERNRARFGAGAWDPLFGAGPRPDLFGRPADDRGLEAPVAGATVDATSALEEVEPQAPFLPALVAGELDRDVRGAVAVTLGGRVAATVEPEGRRFRALLPWTWLRTGRNPLGLLLVDPSAGGVIRGRIALGGATTLNDRELVLGDGKTVPLSPRPRARVETLARSARGAYLRGVVEGGGAPAPSAEVLVFAGDALVARTRSGFAVPSDQVPPGWSGAAEFSLDVPLPEAALACVRVIVRSGGAAAEASLPGSTPGPEPRAPASP